MKELLIEREPATRTFGLFALIIALLQMIIVLVTGRSI